MVCPKIPKTNSFLVRTIFCFLAFLFERFGPSRVRPKHFVVRWGFPAVGAGQMRSGTRPTPDRFQEFDKRQCGRDNCGCLRDKFANADHKGENSRRHDRCHRHARIECELHKRPLRRLHHANLCSLRDKQPQCD